MIKPVTYQGIYNFKANLYALEVKSRFIDQNHADGYYSGYGNELAATIIDNTIQIGTGVFVIQGRMNEIEGNEIVTVPIENGKVGYVCLRTETYHPSDEENTTLIVKTGITFDSITLTQEDTYQKGAETSNKVYELPIYSFSMENGNITSLTKLIKVVADYATVKALADNANTNADTALTKATNAENNANTALTNSQNAVNTADQANQTATQANKTANEAYQFVEPNGKVKVMQGMTNKNKNLGTDANGNVMSLDYVTIGGDITIKKEVNTTTGEISLVFEFPEEDKV